ncbi:hypothetical protein L3X38_013108 [Prunus dulcis]|uniref:Uncharacterized protein n=1 Tax=Prunus dulcis TaxID=3755 RepID=A0AAD4ZH06_PRUDU|nr:hypothetical protein L3X38_013108 [Prunus dulcis]
MPFRDPLRPLVLGGDQSISYPVVRAVSEKLVGPVDIYKPLEGNEYSHAATFSFRQDEGFEGTAREPPVDVHVDDDDFAGLACPLDDLQAVFILESETHLIICMAVCTLGRYLRLITHINPASKVDHYLLQKIRISLFNILQAYIDILQVFSESQQNPKGLAKSTDRDLHRQDWDDEEKLETSVRKLHQGYQEFQNKRKKIQVIDVKNLQLPSKPGRGRVLTKNKFLTSSRKCLAF